MAEQPRPSGVKDSLSVAKKKVPETKREAKVSGALALINLIRKLEGRKCKSEEEEKGCSDKMNTKNKNKKNEPSLKIGKVEEKKELEDKEGKGKKRKKEDEEPEALVESKAELEKLCDELVGQIKGYDDGLDELVQQLKSKGFSGALANSKAELERLLNELAVEPSIRNRGYHDCLHELVHQLKSKGFSGTVQVDLLGFTDADTAFNSCVGMGLTEITTTIKGIVQSPNPVLPPPPPAPQPPPPLEIPTPVDLDSPLEHDPDNSWRRRKD